MGVGLESGLALDAIADEPGELGDAADHAALRGDAEELAEALLPLAERLLAIRSPAPARRFRSEATGVSGPRWNRDVVRRRVVAGRLLPPGVYRVELDPRDLWAWLLGADFVHIARLTMPARGRRGAIWCACVEEGDDRVNVERFGPGHAQWQRPA